MTALVVVTHVLVSLFLIAVILLQAGRGQGLSWGVFGGSPQSIFGTKTASFFTRLTSACAVIFLLTCIGLNVLEVRKSRSLLGPPKPITQVDFERIKKALDEASASKVVQQPPLQASPSQSSAPSSVGSPQVPEEAPKGS